MLFSTSVDSQHFSQFFTTDTFFWYLYLTSQKLILMRQYFEWLSAINYTIHTIVGSFLDNKIFRLTGQQALERHALRIRNFSEYLIFFSIKVIILEMKAVISNYLNVMWMILRACKYDLLASLPTPSSLGWRKILGLSQLLKRLFQYFFAVFSACHCLRMLLLKWRRKIVKGTFHTNSKQEGEERGLRPHVPRLRQHLFGKNLNQKTKNFLLVSISELIKIQSGNAMESLIILEISRSR